MPFSPSFDPMRSHARVRRRYAAVVVAALGLSCLPGIRPPEVAPSGTLGLKDERRGPLTAGPFAIVHASPVGETSDPSEVSVVFNRPMRALELAGAETASPVKLEALGGFGSGAARTPPGEWRWLGTSALSFAPSTPLARATPYRVTVPAGIRALDGSTLAKEASFEFTTPRPRLVRSDPYEGSAALKPGSGIELFFDQPVSIAEVEAHVRLEVEPSKGKSRVLTVKASYPKADTTKARVRIVPASPMPLASAIVMRIDDKLRGLEGPLPTQEQKEVRFRTYGPLAVNAFDCYRETPHKKCAAHDGVRLEFSNRVRRRDVAKFVTIEPGVKIAWAGPTVARGSDDDDLTSIVWLPVKLAPAQSYRAVVRAGLKDEFGQSLAATHVSPFETDDEWPDFEVGVAGTVLDADKTAPPAIPLASVNAKTLEIAGATFDEASYARFVFDDKRSNKSFDRLAAVPGAHKQTIRPNAPSNVRSLRSLDLASLVGKPIDRGLVAFAVRGPGKSAPVERMETLVVTDLGITAKMSRFGSVVWVTSLATAKPLANVTVSVRTQNGNEAFSGTTDADGLVRIPADRYDPSRAEDHPDGDGLVFARSGSDLAVRRVREMISPWSLVSSSDPSGRLDPIGFVFTDRGVYRPGETLRTKGLFRIPTEKGSSTPAGRTVDVRAFDPQGESVFEKTVRLGEFGEFAVDVPIPPATRLGTFEVRAELVHPAAQTKTGKKERYDTRGVATARAELAAYKASEFKVSVEPDRPAYVRGDRASFTTRGDYLFGAPMKGGKARVSVRRGGGYFALPLGLKDTDPTYVWNDDAFWDGHPSRSHGASSLANAEGELNAKGEVETLVVLALPEQHGTETVRVESEIEDLTRQTVSSESSAIVHPGEFYVAMARPKEMFVDEGARVATGVLAIEPSGKKRHGVPVTLELVRRTWNSVLRGAGESGATRETRVVDEVVARCTATTRGEPVTCPLAAKTSGYHLIRASARDPRGNTVGASQGLYVLTPAAKENAGAGPGWSMRDGSVLELVTDKTSYDVGDVATVLVKSPFPEAEALVTIERAGVYKTERRVVKGPTPTLRIPITNDMHPNAFVGVHLLRGRTKARPSAPGTGGHAGSADVGAPAFRIGYAELAIRPDDRRLKVSVTPSAKEMRPGQEVEVDVAVTDRKGAPVRANAAIYAVDEGVLMLTGYRTPDPLPTFSASRPLAVFNLESRDDLARIFRLSPTAPGSDKGGEGGGGGPGMRADFRATAFFEPSVLIERGRAKVKFKLPDSLTTYRLMAVVSDAGERFGFGEGQVVTSRRLMVRPALPRFFRAGDFVDAGVIVTSKGLPKTDVDVTFEAEGLTIEGETKRRVSIEASGQAELRFRMRPTHAGNAVLSFRAQAGSESDGLRLSKTIEVPTSIEAVALAGATGTAAAEALGDLRAIRTDVGGLEVSLSSSALVGLDGAVKQVIEYPYGCTEQLTSRLVPLVHAPDLLAFVGAPPIPDAPRVIGETIAKIIKAQKADGSFGYWSDSPSGDSWLTSYVTWALFEAKMRGHAVPTSTLDLATAAVRNRGRKGGPESALAADVLAIAGAPDGGLQTMLYESREKLPLFARALLAHAYAVSSPKSAEAQKLARDLLRDIDNHVRATPTGAIVVSNHGDAYAPLLDSDARTTAMVLRALIAAEPNHPLAARLARGLVGIREGGAFRSTQEAGWALVALDGYRRAQENGAIAFDARVFFGDQLLKQLRFEAPGSATTHVAAARLFGDRAPPSGSSALTFQVVGTGNLFYEARLRYARRELPADTLDRGFFVRKTLRTVKPDQIDEALRTMPSRSSPTVNAGDLVLVDLHVVSTSPRDQVVVDDPLPAGFEALAAKLRTTSSAGARVDDEVAFEETAHGEDVEGADSDSDDARSGGHAVHSTFFHREVHDDRVLTFVEHMPAGIFHYRYLARATSRGNYLLPPTRAECMYQPEVFGRTAGQVIEVR